MPESLVPEKGIPKAKIPEIVSIRPNSIIEQGRRTRAISRIQETAPLHKLRGFAINGVKTETKNMEKIPIKPVSPSRETLNPPAEAIRYESNAPTNNPRTSADPKDGRREGQTSANQGTEQQSTEQQSKASTAEKQAPPASPDQNPYTPQTPPAEQTGTGATAGNESNASTEKPSTSADPKDGRREDQTPANQGNEQQSTAKTAEKQATPTENAIELSDTDIDTKLSEAESVGTQNNQERLERVVKSLESQVKSLEEALKQGSEFQQNLRKGIFGPKVLFMLRLINILANNPAVTNLLKLDSKVADIKDLWGKYQGLEKNSRDRKRNPDTFQVAATFNGEAQDKGSEAKEANFENANKEFIKGKSLGFLQEIASELKENEVNMAKVIEDMIDEIDSLMDAGKEVDLSKLTQVKPQILDKIKFQVQNFARGKINKSVLGLNIMVAIRS